MLIRERCDMAVLIDSRHGQEGSLGTSHSVDRYILLREKVVK